MVQHNGTPGLWHAGRYWYGTYKMHKVADYLHPLRICLVRVFYFYYALIITPLNRINQG